MMSFGERAWIELLKMSIGIRTKHLRQFQPKGLIFLRSDLKANDKVGGLVAGLEVSACV
jgi:hypothetical protein